MCCVQPKNLIVFGKIIPVWVKYIFRHGQQHFNQVHISLDDDIKMLNITIFNFTCSSFSFTQFPSPIKLRTIHYSWPGPHSYLP